MVDLDCEGVRSRLAGECSQTVRSATCLARTFATGRARRLEGYRLLFCKSRLLAADLLNCLRPADNLRCCCSLFDVDLSAAHLLDPFRQVPRAAMRSFQSVSTDMGVTGQ